MNKNNKKEIMNIVYLFSGFILISIIGGVVFVSMSYMETDSKKYKKDKALQKIEKEYWECRDQKTDDWQELLVKCVNEKFDKEEALN